MLKVLSWAPEDVGIGNVSLGKVRIEIQSTSAMKLSLFQPSPAGVETKILAGVYVGEGRISERKFRVMLNGLGELAYGPGPAPVDPVNNCPSAPSGRHHTRTDLR